MLLQSECRMYWEEDQDYSSLNLSDSFKKAFTGIPRLLASEISLDTGAAFDPAALLAGPSISFDSFGIDAIQSEDQLYLDFDPDSSVLEFDETGLLMADTDKSAPTDSAYYGGDLFFSWEDDIFAGALSISELPEASPKAVVASPPLPVSPVFVAVSIDDSDAEPATPSKPSKKPASRKRSSPSTGPSPASKTRSSLKDSSSTPKRQRRHSSKNTVTFALEPQILAFPLDREERAVPSPKQKKGKIGLLSSSTHELSDAVIRNIFRAEQVVTLCKIENEDDEDVDIL